MIDKFITNGRYYKLSLAANIESDVDPSYINLVRYSTNLNHNLIAKNNLDIINLSQNHENK